MSKFAKLIHIYAFYNDFRAPLAMVLCSMRCISQTTALICMCDKPLENALNDLIGCKFISRRGAISTRRAIAVPLFQKMIKNIKLVCKH